MEKSPIDLSNFDLFMDHKWIKALRVRFNEKDTLLARSATTRITNDLTEINFEYTKNNNRSAITTVTSRVKKEKSFFAKLLKKCNEFNECITQDSLIMIYESIHDIAGVRFSCPYIDEILPVINDLVRPKLKQFGYAVDFGEDNSLVDEDYLELGNDKGYRSYHFFVKIPTPVDIYGTHESCLCEIQARSELQNVWAVKSHDLLYKSDGQREIDERTKKEMKEISNLLHSADEFLISIRKRLKE